MPVAHYLNEQHGKGMFEAFAGRYRECIVKHSGDIGRVYEIGTVG